MKNRKTLFILLVSLLSLAGTATWAQTASVSGQISTHEGAGNVPLPGVTIRLIGTVYGNVSDANGQYQIPHIPAGIYQIAVTYVGYRDYKTTIQLKAGQNATLNVSLEEESLQTDEVVVTAARRQQLSSEAPVSISVLGAKEIETRNIQVLDDALRYTPGVQLSDNQVNVRGSSGFAYGVGSRIQFLIDGIPMLNAESGGISFNLVPTAQVKQIEVIKGPGSALYGGGALGGVINVITKDFPAKPQTSFRSFGGAYPKVRYPEWRNWSGGDRTRYMWGGSLAHAQQVSPKLGFWVSATYLGTEGYMSNSNGNEVQTAAKIGWNITPKLKWETLITGTWSHKFGFVYWKSAREALVVARTDLLNGSSDSEVRKLSVMPVFTWLISNTSFLTVKNRFYGVHSLPIEYGGVLGPKERQVLGGRYGTEVQYNADLKKNRYLIAGASIDRNATNSERMFGGGSDPKSQPEAALFGQYEQKIGPKVNTVIGLRYDYYRVSTDETVTKWSPKVSFSCLVNPLLNLRAAWGLGFRVPGVAERYVNNSEFLPIIANPTIKPEQSNGIELGAKGFFPLPIENWGGQYDVAYFYNVYTDLVEPKFLSDERAFKFINLTKGRIQGMDASMSLGEKSGKILFNAGYTYLDTQDQSDANNLRPLAFRSRHLLLASFSIRPWKMLDLGVDYRYASAFDRIDSDFGYFVPDANIHLPTKVWDLRIGYDFGHIRTSFLVKNAGEYYYMERPAVIAPIRHFILQLMADL